LKKHINPLKTNWRNFTTTSKKVTTPFMDSAKAPELNVKLKTSEIKADSLKNLNVSSKVNSSGGSKLPGLSKLHNNPKNIIKRFKNNSKGNDKTRNFVYGRRNTLEKREEFNNMYRIMSRDEQDRYHDFENHKHYSKINKNPAKPGKLDLNGVKNRRLGAAFSRVISKIAEDNVGAYTEGDDFWDADRLAMRTINKESIYKCRMSREKHNVIVALDSSPSCSAEAHLYSQIAIECIKYGDIELYDAPNARLVHMYSNKNNKFVEFLTLEDLKKNVHRWSLFKNRTIIFFGDFDGVNVVFNSTSNNKVYYFCSKNKLDCEDKIKYKNMKGISHNFRNLKMIPGIWDLNKFMDACKKLK